MEIKDIIKTRRTILDLTLSQVADFVGVSKGTVQKWESGYIANIKRDKIMRLAEILDINPLVLINGHDGDSSDFSFIKFPSPDTTEDFETFPVIGEIAAGFDHTAYEDWDGDTIDIPKSYLKGHDKSDYFVLRVKGSSMYPFYQDGDKVLVLKQSTMNYSGEVGVVIYDGDCGTLKRVEYIPGEDWMRLVPINPNYEPVLIEGDRLEQCKIIGIPKLLMRDIK